MARPAIKSVSKAFVVVWNNNRGLEIPCESYLADETGRATHGEDIDPACLAHALRDGRSLLTYEGFESEIRAIRRARNCGPNYSVRKLPAGCFFYDETDSLCVVAADVPAAAVVMAPQVSASADHSANSKLVEITRLLGIEATYFCGNYTLRHNGQYLGRMTAEEWLRHFRQSFKVAESVR